MPAGVPMLALLLAAAALAPDYEQLIAYDTVQVAPGVTAFMPRRTDTAIVSGNSIAVFGDDGVLVVDSGHFPEATRRMIAQIRKVTKKPVRWLVNTYWHSDHNHGNRLYQQAFPGMAIIGTEATRKNFDQPFLKDEMKKMNEQAEQVKPCSPAARTAPESRSATRARRTSARRSTSSRSSAPISPPRPGSRPS